MKHKQRWDLMGSKVTVTQLIEKSRVNNKVYWVTRKIEPASGWITGFRTVYEGTVRSDAVINLGYYDPPEYASHLDVSNSVPCLLVCLSPYENPKHVPLNGYTVGGNPGPKKYEITEESRQYLREIMKDHPRDERGRWLKV
jgi:hypothetical protein